MLIGRLLSPRVGGALLLAVAAVFAAIELSQVLGGWIVPGIDFLPLRHAAEALLRGDSVFTDPLFVYPPIAALVLLPTALGTPAAAFAGWVLTGVAALLLAAWLVARNAPAGRRLAVFAVAGMGLLGGTIADRSLLLGNLSGLLVPVAVGVLLAFHRGRWTLGCALLAGSLLVKPLLAPLLLVPLLHGRWAAAARTVLPAGGLLLASMLLVPGGERFPAVLRYCLGGTNLHGDNAVNNLSLRGWAEGQQAPAVLGVAGAVVVVLLVAARIAGVVRGGGRPDPVWLGNLLLLGTFLAGGISEVHFLLTAYATVLLLVVLRPGLARRRAWFVPGLLLLALPESYPSMLFGAGDPFQGWFVAAELLLLAALLVTPARVAASPAPAPLWQPAAA